MRTRIDSKRVKVGDIVRLYGFRGQFRVGKTTSKAYNFHAQPIGTLAAEFPHNDGFPECDASVVEINGTPVPLQSYPLAAPSDDYPWPPMFDYHDGPPGRRSPWG